MSLNPDQKIYPYLSYEDAPAAIDFLCKAFGFEERTRMAMPDGRLGHAELSLAGTVIMLASVYEEMGEAQFHGARQYGAVDPEGHRWIFSTQLREVAREDSKPPE